MARGKFEGVGMTNIIFLPCSKNEFPSWCDVYIDGMLMFENVFVEIGPNFINLFNGYRELPASKEADYTKRVAFIHSNNYFVVARKSDKYE